MALQHLRSSTADKRPTPAAMSDGQLAMNTNLASPGLFFKDSNGDLVKAGPVHVGTTAPNATPGAGGQAGNSKGELWLDTSTTPNQLKTWNGSAFVSALPDELPVSKLQDGSARQLLQTDAAGTGVEWASNIDIPGTLDVTGITTFDSAVICASLGYLNLPVGTTAERPVSPNSGMIRYNTTLSYFEGYGVDWGKIGGGATGGGSDSVFFENDQTVTTNYTLTTNKNAVTAGPVVINSGVTVTIPSGSTWVVV